MDLRAGEGAAKARFGLHKAGFDAREQRLDEGGVKPGGSGRHGILGTGHKSKRGARLPFYHNLEPYRPAAARSSSALSVFSQGNSSRPKWP